MASWTCGNCGASASGTDELVEMVKGAHMCKDYSGDVVVHQE